MASYETRGEPDRERGVLAPVDREYLLGLKEYDHRQSAYQRREDIQERVYNSVLDLALLSEQFDSKSIDKVRDNLTSDAAEHSVMRGPGGVDDSIHDALAFLLRVFGNDIDAIERAVSEATARELRRDTAEDWTVDVEVDAERRRGDDEILSLLADDRFDELRPREAKWALEHLEDTGALDTSQVQQ